jgi:hypothetical protein
MLKKILLGTAIAVVFSTASYAQTPASNHPIYQDWFTSGLNAYMKVANADCKNPDVENTIDALTKVESSIETWIFTAEQLQSEPNGSSDSALKARLKALDADIVIAQNELDSVRNMIKNLNGKDRCKASKIILSPPGSVGLTPQQADGVLRVLLGLPTSDTERTARDHDKTLDRPDDSKTDGKTDSKTERKTETKTETNPEHSTRTAKPEKVDAPKQVARTASVKHTPEVRTIEAHQTISHVTSHISSAHVNSMGNLGSMHGMSAMHMGGLGGLGGMHMGGLGGMHFGRM